MPEINIEMKRIAESGLDKALIQKIIDQTDTTQGEIPVVVNGDSYLVSHSKKRNDTTRADCSEKRCYESREIICQCCKKYSWPVGHLILVCDTSGNCCYCYCR